MPVRRGMGNATDDTGIGMNFLFSDSLLDVTDNVLHRLPHRLAIGRMQQVDCPLHEGITHILRQPHDVEEHRDRQWSAEGRREFALAPIHELRKQVSGSLPDQTLQLQYALWAE